MKAIGVKALPHYKIEIIFDDGLSGVADLGSLVGQGIFRELEDEAFFKKAYLTDYAIAWNEELEIDLFTIYAEIAGKNPEEMLSVNFNYASN